MVEFLQASKDALLDGLGQRHVVCGKNQFHAFKMQRTDEKIQFFLWFDWIQRKSCQFSCLPAEAG
jgi:hypothetical protein